MTVITDSSQDNNSNNCHLLSGLLGAYYMSRSVLYVSALFASLSYPINPFHGSCTKYYYSPLLVDRETEVQRAKGWSTLVTLVVWSQGEI